MSWALCRRLLLAVVLASAMSISSRAFAGLLNGNGAAIPGWTGTTPFTNGVLYGTVDYAVFLPGSFPYVAGGYTPTASEVVYTYQVFVGNGSAPLSLLQVLLDDTADNVGNFLLEATDSPPDSQNLTPFVDATWGFSTGVNSNGMTYGLAFSSTQLPQWSAGATVDDGTTAYVIPLPSTSSGSIPEPGSISVLAVVTGAMLRRRKMVVE